MHKRFVSSKTLYNSSPLNWNNRHMDGIKGKDSINEWFWNIGFNFGPTAAVSTKNYTSNVRQDVNKTFTRNHSKKRYRDNSAEGNILDSYMKSFDSKRLRKTKKIKKKEFYE